jgi:hypothetical protein
MFKFITLSIQIALLCPQSIFNKYEQFTVIKKFFELHNFSLEFNIIIIIYYLFIYLFTAIGFAPGDSSPTLVQTKTIKQHYTVVQHNTIKRKQHNAIKCK